MKIKLVAVLLFFTGAFICGLSSCVNPVACFTVNVPPDSIHVNEQVYFSAACSEKAEGYIWQVLSAFDTSGSYNQGFDQTFTDTGAVTVNLTVTNGDKSNFATQTFHVIP